VATGGGYAKRTPASAYPVQGRGGLGVVTARIVEARGELIGALMVGPEDEVFAITSAGGVIRTAASEIKQSGRQTMGVRLVNLTSGQTLVAIARNEEMAESEEAGLGEGLDEAGLDEAGLDEAGLDEAGADGDLFDGAPQDSGDVADAEVADDDAADADADADADEPDAND